MSTQENSPSPSDSARGGSIVVSQPMTFAAEDQQLAAGVTLGPPSSPGQNLHLMLHALRRHVVLSTGLGLLLAAGLGALAWFWYGERYTASAYLQVELSQPTLVFQTADTRRDPRIEFQVYRGTQQILVTSPFVITAALRDPDISRLPSVAREGDPVTWLAEEIRAVFPGEAEIMQVSMTGKNAAEVASLVQAVVNAYLTEVVGNERGGRTRRLSELDRVYAEKEVDLRERRGEMKRLADELGSGDPGALSMKQQIVLEEFGNYRKRLMETEFVAMRAEATLQARQATLANIGEEEISEYELYAHAKSDPEYRRLQQELGWRQSDADYTNMVTRKGADLRHISQYLRPLQVLQEQLKQREDDMRKEVRAQKHALVAAEIKTLEAELRSFRDQEKELQTSVEARRAEAERIGGSHLELEMMKAEIEQLNGVLQGVANERERLRVELGSQSRIRLLQGAQVPMQSERAARIALTFFVALLGLMVPGAGVMLWDMRLRRINTAKDVSEGLGLPVIGSVPAIPARALRDLDAPTRRSQQWNIRLTESIDGIVARLLRREQTDDTHVILVSSAVGGEGKTTLATHLAMNLARKGRDVLLIDFDLRRPALHEVFGIPLEPGICQVLRQQSDVANTIYETDVDHLSVMPAGRWDRAALAALANGAPGPIFEQLRQRFEFVIVDSAPLLPVADTRFISQHVDCVVLSVFRDISEAPRIADACEILRAFGVSNLEAVVTGSSETGRGKYLAYQASVEAPVESTSAEEPVESTSAEEDEMQ